MPLIASRKELFDRLANNIVDVRFRKVNGEDRLMRATLMPSKIPGTFDTNQYAEDHVNSSPKTSGRMIVWDIDKGDWRSFLIENVTSIVTPTIDSRSVPTPARVVADPYKSNSIDHPGRSYLDIAFDPRTK